MDRLGVSFTSLMRLFTALDISDEARSALVALIRQLEPEAPFRWSKPSNLHITTKFIGQWEESDRHKLSRALAGMPKPGPIPIGVRGIGWFPNPHSPRVLFAGIQSGPELAELHRQTDAACQSIGIPGEEKPFNPHLTLARVPSKQGLQDVRQRIAQLPEAEFGQFTATAFHLYESVPKAGGSEYIKLEEFPLL